MAKNEPLNPSKPTPPLELEQLVQRAWPHRHWQQTRLLVAVSGGGDSVALLRCLVRMAGGTNLISVAHFNHGWRGEESRGDEAFVRQLTQTLGLECHFGHNETAETLQSEEHARNERYAFLTKTAYRIGARYVVTAHTADDGIETMLHNLFRGTGLDGVASMDNTRPLDEQLVLVRPMLGCSKSHVVSYLEYLQQPFRQDSTNDDTRYRRNFLRHKILPLVRSEYGCSVDERLRAFSEIVSETTELLDQLAHSYWDTVEMNRARPELPNSIVFPSAARLPVAWPVLRQALVQRWHALGWPIGKMSRQHWQAIRDRHSQLSSSPSASTDEIASEWNLPNQLELATQGDWILIRR